MTRCFTGLVHQSSSQLTTGSEADCSARGAESESSTCPMLRPNGHSVHTSTRGAGNCVRPRIPADAVLMHPLRLLGEAALHDLTVQQEVMEAPVDTLNHFLTVGCDDYLA